MLSENHEPENDLDQTNGVLQTLNKVITEIQNSELQKANQFVTRHTINLRVLKHVSDLLNLPWTFRTTEKSVYLHPDNAAIIDQKWNKCLKGNFHLSHEEMNAYKLTKTDDYINTYDLSKFINILVKKDLVLRDPNSSEKILRNNDLNKLLAVDGFSGYLPTDMKNYIQNLQYGTGYDLHVDAVRKMYEITKVMCLSGTDAACVVFLAIVQVFSKYITDDETKLLLLNISHDVKNYLTKNSQYYKDIETCISHINDLIAFYQENMSSESKLSQLAILKVANLIMRFKKKKTFVGGKRGRKKITNSKKRGRKPVDDDEQ